MFCFFWRTQSKYRETIHSQTWCLFWPMTLDGETFPTITIICTPRHFWRSWRTGKTITLRFWSNLTLLTDVRLLERLSWREGENSEDIHWGPRMSLVELTLLEWFVPRCFIFSMLHILNHRILDNQNLDGSNFRWFSWKRNWTCIWFIPLFFLIIIKKVFTTQLLFEGTLAFQYSGHDWYPVAPSFQNAFDD